MINIIAAIGNNLALGKDNKLIFDIPEDLQYFKKVTTGKTVVMGRKTYESIGKALPNRKNIVLTRQNIDIDDVEIVHNVDEILNRQDEIFIIGGEEIYKLFIPYADNIYLTEIDAEAEADSFFPDFDKNLYQKEIIKQNCYNGLNYTFVIYKRK